MVKLIKVLMLSAGLAGLTGSAFAANDAAIPVLTQQGPVAVVPADAATEPQAVSIKADEIRDPRTSLDFLQTNPLTPAESTFNQRGDAKTVIHFLTGVDMDRLAKPEGNDEEVFKDVAHPISVLIFEKCTQTGDAAEGSSECEWRYSSGFKSSMKNTHATQADGIVSHTVLRETNREGTWKAERNVHYTARLENGNKLAESYDILYDIGKGEESSDRIMTREVMRYDYKQGQKHPHSMSWTKYQDRLNTKPRDVELHAVLVYDEDGRPDRGYADKWEDGQKVKSLFAWQSEKSMLNFSTRELWAMWEKWIRNGPAHVFIV